MPNYFAIPQDVLFFRDARPMVSGVGSGGHGARWPEPSIIFDAVHAALHRAFPVPLEKSIDAAAFLEFIRGQNWDWQHPHRYIARSQRLGARRNRQPDERFRNQRFGALQTAGPFPALGANHDRPPSAWLFPAPADYVPNSNGASPFLRPLRDRTGVNDLDPVLRYLMASPSGLTKKEPAAWWNKTAIEAALRNESPPGDGLWESSELYNAEWVTGIGLDPDREAQDGDRIYSAQYLRMRPHIALGFSACLPTLPGRGEDGLCHLFPRKEFIICGGQQRACRVAPVPEEILLKDLLPVAQLQKLKPAPDGRWRIKWLLLSPAVFPFLSDVSPGGWLPNWIAARPGQDHDRLFEASDVLLKPAIPCKEPGISREAWRLQVARDVAPIKARLVAARVPKPVIVTGWSEQLHVLAHACNREVETTEDRSPDKGVRRTLLAVPAGAVYYFEAGSEVEARNLANVLSWHGRPAVSGYGRTIENRRSAVLGEKGFGLGVCGTWDFFENLNAASPH